MLAKLHILTSCPINIDVPWIRPRLKFETAEDRRKAAEKIRAEAEQASLLYVCLNCTTLVNQESNQPRHKTTVATCTRCPYQLI